MKGSVHHLKDCCDQILERPQDVATLRARVITLREGLDQLEAKLIHLQQENDGLKAHRRTLEMQVMDMAHEADRERHRYRKILVLFGDELSGA